MFDRSGGGVIAVGMAAISHAAARALRLLIPSLGGTCVYRRDCNTHARVV